MKLKSEFLLKKIAGENILMFLSPDLKNKVITLNETGAFLFDLISKGKNRDELISSLLEEYEIDEETAKKDVDAFLDTLTKVGALED